MEGYKVAGFPNSLQKATAIESNQGTGWQDRRIQGLRASRAVAPHTAHKKFRIALALNPKP